MNTIKEIFEEKINKDENYKMIGEKQGKNFLMKKILKCGIITSSFTLLAVGVLVGKSFYTKNKNAIMQ